MKEMMMRLVKEEEGQGLVEYGLITGLVAVIAIAVFSSGALGDSIKNIFSRIAGALDGVTF